MPRPSNGPRISLAAPREANRVGSDPHPVPFSRGEKGTRALRQASTGGSVGLKLSAAPAPGGSSSATETAKETVNKAQGDAATKAEIILSEARQQTKQEMARAKKSLEGEIISLVSDATEVIAGEKIDAKRDAALVSRALAGGAKDEA